MQVFSTLKLLMAILGPSWPLSTPFFLPTWDPKMAPKVVQKCSNNLFNYTLVAKDPKQKGLVGFVFVFFRGNLLSTLGPSPAKIQKNKFISKIPKKPPKPDEIHVPNSDWIFGDFSREIC